MKDYEHSIIWLDYVDKLVPRSRGRRLRAEACVADPSLAELEDAAREAGIEVSASEPRARHPRRHARSGYIAVPKSPPKSRIISQIAARLAASRRRQKKARS